MASELATWKWAYDDYETVGEADDIEAGMMEDFILFSHTFHIASMDVRSTLGHKYVIVTSGKSDFAIIGLGLQKIPTNSSQ